ncbi:DUF1275 family protein [uncultured Flavobacterium sp.]|uniref:DUF1275 family protein n=1 Tax=uncultured Flavobacterium sp. TaxID=165435 RepID=UPI0030CA5602
MRSYSPIITIVAIIGSHRNVFTKNPKKQKKLKTRIYLRLSIITFFFIGCFSGGFMYHYLKIKTLFVAAFFLLIAQWYDYLWLKFHVIKRKALRH